MSVVPAASAPVLDAAPGEWLRALRAYGAIRDEAIVRLHALLLRAARFEAARSRGRLPPHLRDELETLLKDLIAEHAPMDALERDLIGGRSQ